MAELWEMIVDKVMHGLFVCLITAAVVLLGIAVWHYILYYMARNRIDSAKQIYNAVKLGETKERALVLAREYIGTRDQYIEEAILPDGKREIMLCVQFAFGRGEMGEMRLTYIDDKLVQKQQNGIW
ncbi:MAG: hypothetical protein E7474_09310 [Ruminococcaceae bacterium]|nr:hypothetical protein [Oscillospiraceae bacterium]